MANPAAEKLFAEVHPPLVKDGRLCAAAPMEMFALERALRACATYRFDDTLSLSVRLSGSPGHGVVVRLAPPPSSGSKTGLAAAIAFISLEGRAALDVQALVATLYNLTPAETLLVQAFSNGLTPEHFADQRSVSLATVKTQLRSVFLKTGTRRQADLMRLIYSIAH